MRINDRNCKICFVANFARKQKRLFDKAYLTYARETLRMCLSALLAPGWYICTQIGFCVISTNLAIDATNGVDHVQFR